MVTNNTIAPRRHSYDIRENLPVFLQTLYGNYLIKAVVSISTSLDVFRFSSLSGWFWQYRTRWPQFHYPWIWGFFWVCGVQKSKAVNRKGAEGV